MLPTPLGQHQADRGSRHLGKGLVDGGKGRRGPTGEWEVVETYEAEMVGDLDVLCPRRLQYAQGPEIAAGKDS
jgi:hypothetical protein